MAVVLNQQALENARRLLDEGRYMINTVWGTSAPTHDEETEYVEKHGWNTYSEWYLGVDLDEPADSTARYKFPYGNFRKLHRSGVIAAKQRAAQSHYDDIVEGANELLDLLDRMNAC